MITKFTKVAFTITALSTAALVAGCDTMAGPVSPTEAMSFCSDTLPVEGFTPTLMPGAVEPITFDDFDLGPDDFLDTAQKDALMHCYEQKMAQ